MAMLRTATIPVAEKMSGKPCILLVEDEFLIRIALVDTLSDCDMDCREASYG